MNQKSFNDIVRNIINNIHDSMPDIDTKEGTFIRDVFINPPSDVIAGLYGDMKLMEISQSILTATELDLDKIAANYFVYRKPANGSSGKLRFYISGTNKPIINYETMPEEIIIPVDTIVSTIANYAKTAVQYKTTSEAVVKRYTIGNLPIDQTNGYRYIELSAISLQVGTISNALMGEISQQITNITDGIEFVNNPFDFTGGINNEDDASLALRINLAISGSNIGTKDGYMSYILKQNGVIDCKIVGPGDTIMFRDGGHFNEQGNYIIGSGGMVDIYIRGHQNEQTEYDFLVTTDYASGSNPFSDIILPKQPVNNIVSIVSNSTEKVFINAADYEMEKGSTLSGSGTVVTNIKYYKDIFWDFSVKDNFPDVEYYPLPIDMNATQIQLLKQQVDLELKVSMDYMTNMNYGINWDLMTTRNDSSGSTALFTKYFYNTKVFKIVAKDSTSLNGRTFIKKNDKIYVRVYAQPDYVLIKDVTAKGSSILGKDKLKWLNGEKPFVEDTLIIKYNIDQLIQDLQDGMELKRILTADVLIKQAEKLSIEVILEAYCYPQFDPNAVKQAIINRIITYINNIKKLGGDFDRSDIITVARQTDGVDAINIDTIKISQLGDIPKNKIIAKNHQYFEVENIIIDVFSNDQIMI
jgi:phage-related baseplate assembly protein